MAPRAHKKLRYFDTLLVQRLLPHNARTCPLLVKLVALLSGVCLEEQSADFDELSMYIDRLRRQFGDLSEIASRLPID